MGGCVVEAMLQIVQIVGAILVLAAFVAAQLRLVHQESLVYLVLNVVGAGILAVLAFQEQQWGFLLLEGVWTLVSLRGVIQWARRGRRGEAVGPGDRPDAG
jgi:hypothetical protein